jgi:hypothetical protein
VDDIVEELLVSLRTHHTGSATSGSGDSSRGDVRDYVSPLPLPSQAVSLPLPPAVAAQHRVQFSLRGRRFETTMSVAITYCLSFYVFFHWPFDGSTTVGDVAETADPQKAPAALAEEALLAHYVATVEPVLLFFLQQQQRAVTATAPTPASTAHDAADITPPALPRPQRISYDASAHLWKFEFPPRLSVEAEEQERRRRQMLAGADAEPHITSDEINASPFLLLQYDFMGMLLVYLRRCAKARTEASPAPYPVLPIRWAEMNFDEQVSFVQLLRTFGVVPLIAQYPQPTAPLSTSQFVGADAARVAAAAKAEGEACSLRVRAEEFIRHQQQHQQQQDERHTKDDAENTVRASRHGDMEDLVLPSKGCARCGMSGHTAEECPY